MYSLISSQHMHTDILTRKRADWLDSCDWRCPVAQRSHSNIEPCASFLDWNCEERSLCTRDYYDAGGSACTMAATATTPTTAPAPAACLLTQRTLVTCRAPPSKLELSSICTPFPAPGVAFSPRLILARRGIWKHVVSHPVLNGSQRQGHVLSSGKRVACHVPGHADRQLQHAHLESFSSLFGISQTDERSNEQCINGRTRSASALIFQSRTPRIPAPE